MNPRCIHLRTKGLYIDTIREAAFEEQALCWCNKTLTEIGPDDEPVGPKICDGQRGCYEPLTTIT
jgi:hypothetical protein